jgi:uroporphyrinogen-III synthase
LHLTGDTQAFDLKGALEETGLTVREEVVYTLRPVERLDPVVADGIRTGLLDGVILMSPRTASVLADLALAAGLDGPARRLRYFCLSEAVAKALARLAPKDVHVASRPNTEEVLALLAPAAPEST